MADLPLTRPVAIRISRDVVTATGPEAAGYLQGQLSQDVAALSVGGSGRSFLLAPQGKVVAWLRVTRTADDAFLLDTEGGAGQAVFDRMQRFKLRTKVDFELATWHTVALRGPGALELGGEVDPPTVHAVPAGWPGLEAVDLLGLDVALPAGLDVGTVAEHEAIRVWAGVPAMGAEIDASTIPAELGQWAIDRSVSFTKGCYTGQELVARIDSRGGNVPKPVRALAVTGPGSLTATDLLGSRIRRPDEDKDLGRLTTVAAAGTQGHWDALAIVSRTIEPGGLVSVHTSDGVISEAQVSLLRGDVEQAGVDR